MNLTKTWSYLRACPHCHFWFGKTDLFCVTCWGLANRERSWKKATEYQLDTTVLFCWREENNIVAELIYAFKGGELKEASQRLACWILSSVDTLDIKNAVFIPAPPRKPRNYDHATQLAQSLSGLSGRPYFNALERVDSEGQKHLKQTERWSIKMKLNGTFEVDALKEQRIIFIDDVVTTGATAQAAYLALEKPRNFKVWALAYRPRLAWEAPL
ncbi:MAG: hypothetical protein SGJ18_13490 [Pseudomonadota bacterium]|nr:hypothetical protein [Pseudomonadota bacterium]